jgi:hypothetical protein
MFSLPQLKRRLCLLVFSSLGYWSCVQVQDGEALQHILSVYRILELGMGITDQGLGFRV